jgi:integrator complex subunit 9
MVSKVNFHVQLTIRLCKPRQEKAYIPETPFSHDELIKAGFLAHFVDTTDPKFLSTCREPCVVFAGHPSLRMGPVTHLLKMWAPNPKNSIIFIGRVRFLVEV